MLNCQTKKRPPGGGTATIHIKCYLCPNFYNNEH